jgi:hypothetical protein
MEIWWKLIPGTFDNSFEIQNGNVLNQEPVAVNSSALDQNMCSPTNNGPLVFSSVYLAS